jgi:hypothetical protein
MAAKLARLVDRMLRYGMSFIDRGAEFYDAQHRKLQVNKRKAANLGFQIIEAPQRSFWRERFDAEQLKTQPA